jgi:malonate decarboxylase beta subunit
MGIVARCTNAVIMSEEARLGMSGPEVIETASGVEEFDSRDRALVWRTTGGKHRYLLGDCQELVADRVADFRAAAMATLARLTAQDTALSLAALEAEQDMLAQRLERFGALAEPMEIWAALGVAEPRRLPLLEAGPFVEQAAPYRIGAN